MEPRIFTIISIIKIKHWMELDQNLDHSRQHFLGLISLQTFYHIPNKTEKNNVFLYGIAASWQRNEIPVGTYKDIIVDNSKSAQTTVGIFILFPHCVPENLNAAILCIKS